MNIPVWYRYQSSLLATVRMYNKVWRSPVELDFIEASNCVKIPIRVELIVQWTHCTMPLQNRAILHHVIAHEYCSLLQIWKQLGCYSEYVQKNLVNRWSIRFIEAIKLWKISTMSSTLCKIPLQNRAIVHHVRAYEYSRLIQLSKQLGCYSRYLQKSLLNNWSIRFSEASNFVKFLCWLQLCTMPLQKGAILCHVIAHEYSR